MIECYLIDEHLEMIAVTETIQNETTAPVGDTNQRVQALDCLRAIACLIVILSHTQKYTTDGGWSIGAYGVGLFCVLSGYLITSILLRDEKEHGHVDITCFLKRRCLRILPAYFAVLLPCALLMKTGVFLKNHGSMVAKTLSEFPFFVTLTHNHGDGIGINHLWSISVEEQFYCLLPLLLIATKSKMLRQVFLIATSLYMVRYASLGSNEPYFCNAAFISLIIGSLMAMNFGPVTAFLNRFKTPTILCSAAVLLAASVLGRFCPYGPLYSTACALIVWLCTTKCKDAPALNPLAYVGKVSYGIYLIHLPVCLVIYWYLSKFALQHFVPLSFAISAALSILLGALSWELFEKRILALQNKFKHRSIDLILAAVSPLLLTVGAVLHLLHK